MTIKITRSEIYIPEWNNNRESKEPIKVHLKFLTTEERIKTSTFKTHIRQDQTVECDPIFDYRAMLDFAVQKIENLFVEAEDGAVIEIKTIAALLKEPGLKSLYDELSLYVSQTSGLSDQAKKN